MNTPVYQRIGDSHVFTWLDVGDLGIAIYFDGLRESSDNLNAIINVKTALPIDGTEKQGHIHFATPNLYSDQTRERLAKRLGEKTDIKKEIWDSMLEYATVKINEIITEPESLEDLSEGEIVTDRDYLLPWLLPANEPTHWFADSEGGKSLMAMFVALACTLQLEMPNKLRPTRKCNVLYLDYETHKDEMKRRLQKICNGLGIPRPRIYYMRNYRPLVAEIGHIRKKAQEINAGLVILDSVTFCTDKKLIDTESAAEVYAALDSLKTTVLTIGHITKEDAKATGRASAYGNMAWRAKARNSWGIRSAESENGDKLMAFWHDKDNNGAKRRNPLGFRIKFDDEHHKITFHYLNVEEEPDLAKHGTQAFQVRACLKHAPEPLTVKDIADETGLDGKTVSVVLKRMPDAMIVEGGGKGRGNAAKWGLRASE